MLKSILPISAILAAPLVLTVVRGGKNPTEQGHYVGNGTFPMAGDYEAHLDYMHEGQADHIKLLMGFTIQ